MVHTDPFHHLKWIQGPAIWETLILPCFAHGITSNTLYSQKTRENNWQHTISVPLCKQLRDRLASSQHCWGSSSASWPSCQLLHNEQAIQSLNKSVQVLWSFQWKSTKCEFLMQRNISYFIMNIATHLSVIDARFGAILCPQVIHVICESYFASTKQLLNEICRVRLGDWTTCSLHRVAC